LEHLDVIHRRRAAVPFFGISGISHLTYRGRNSIMSFFSAIKEFAYGLKVGTSYTVSNRHNFAEKVAAPKITHFNPGA